MGKAPAIVIIARHGARLDAADDQWHFTSPTPYDPPLTYGGWTQSRTLGIRIGSLLQARVDDARKSDRSSSKDIPENKEDTKGESFEEKEGRSRKYRIVIHTSPFLRCVQTAIALSSGISQARGNYAARSQSTSNRYRRRRSTSPMPRRDHAGQYPPGSVTGESPKTRGPSTEEPAVSKVTQPCLLRLDAFLGEWLTPDYFEQITPPPGSVMMLAGAKGELLRRGESVETDLPPNMEKAALGHFPGGWNGASSGTSAAEHGQEGDPQASSSGNHLRGDDIASGSSSTSPRYEEYVAPTPTYAISPSDPIPPGYVSHARDACVEIDYQWDSTREPHNWGTGGEYGEEWSSMHRRFRTGLERMLNWYKSGGHATVEKPSALDTVQPSADEDEDTETVLIMVTHGAGCNALIGALTARPALIDVGMASLTMAFRKDEVPSSAVSQSHLHKASPEIIDEYEVELIASNEHLRVGSNPYQAQQRQPSPSFANQMSSYRNRLGSAPGTLIHDDSSSFGDNPLRNYPVKRVSYGTSRSTSVNRSSSSGLWGSAAASDSADDIIPNFEDPNTITPSTEDRVPGVEGTASQEQSTEQPLSQHGLWSQPLSREREYATKRRWTVVDRNP